MVILLREVYLYFTKDLEGVHYFPGGGGVSNFFQGGGGVSGPPIPLWIRTWAMSL